MDGSQGGIHEAPVEPEAVRRFLADNPEFIRDDVGLLDELGLRIAAGNVLEFGPAALARVHAAHQREAMQRQQMEEIARANFSAQAQMHGAVIDLLDAQDLTDLAFRLDLLARQRFGLVGAVIAAEDAPVPHGWWLLGEGQVSMILGDHGLARMGFLPTAVPLFAQDAARVQSMALVRMAVWTPARQALLAFGSEDPDGFTPDMGSELVAFLARVVERTAERWARP